MTRFLNFCTTRRISETWVEKVEVKEPLQYKILVEAAKWHGEGDSWIDEYWGGRLFSEEEAKAECRDLLKEFRAGTFNPWSEEPLREENGDWLCVECMSHGTDHTSFYGFDTRRTPIGVSWNSL